MALAVDDAAILKGREPFSNGGAAEPGSGCYLGLCLTDDAFTVSAIRDLNKNQLLGRRNEPVSFKDEFYVLQGHMDSHSTDYWQQCQRLVTSANGMCATMYDWRDQKATRARSPKGDYTGCFLKDTPMEANGAG